MDKISREKRSRNMSRIRSADTSIEKIVRKTLFSLGFRYRLHSKLPGRPDIVFPGKRLAVFINGCFWHKHGCRLTVIPHTRTEFWESKLNQNKERDKRVKKILESSGWRTVTIWECEIEKDIISAIYPILLIHSRFPGGKSTKTKDSS